MLDLWKDAWPLDVRQCPCDVHFTDWAEKTALEHAKIFHFGTGDHHHVGKTLSRDGRDNCVLGITATRPEYDSYMDLVVSQPEIGKRYKALFTDIYQLEPRLLPEFDVVTLFHLCEFWSPANARFSTLDDAGLLTAMIGKLRPGGNLLFYTGSFAFEPASKLIGTLVATNGFLPPERHESLLIYQKA